MSGEHEGLCIVSVNVGRPRLVVHRGRRYTTSINKSPIEGPAALTETGFSDDQQSDMRLHGGADKAICCYPHEHYPYFAEKLGRELDVPSFGENLTTRGLLEDVVAIGDTYRIGDATVQVTQPREPCVKLARKHDEPRIAEWIHGRACSGFYFRVLDAAPITAGDRIEPLNRPAADDTIANAMHAMFGAYDADTLSRFLDNSALSDAWRTRMTKRLNRGA